MKVTDIKVLKTYPAPYGLCYKPQFGDFDNDIDFGLDPVSVAREWSFGNHIKFQFILEKLRAKIQNVLEIGVASDHNGTMSSSYAIFSNIKPPMKYLGIDIVDKSHLNKPELGFYTLRCDSSDKDKVNAKLKELDMFKKITVLVIDGWHSINMALNDWSYTEHLDSNGTVVIHDTNHHPGPYHLVEAIDREIFNVNKFFEGEPDWGLTVVSKK